MKKPTTDSAEMLRRINGFLFDTSDWTIEELRESFIADGIDPDELLSKVKERTKHLINWKEKTK